MITAKSLRGSAAHTALRLLHDMGGVANTARLRLAILSYYRSNTRYGQIIEAPLLRRELITVDGETVAITPAGIDFLRRASAQTAPASAFRALTLAAQRPGRAGAMDYQDIPSMMGGQRVPYFGNRERSGS